MGNFAENLNLGKRVLPPPPDFVYHTMHELNGKITFEQNVQLQILDGTFDVVHVVPKVLILFLHIQEIYLKICLSTFFY